MSANEPPVNRCPRCGNELSPTAPGGVCPACAFGEALAETPADGGASKLSLGDLPPPRGRPIAPPAAKATIKLDLPAVEDEALGTRISHYKLLQKVGEGGCGTVYMADQEHPVRRRVALKVIKLGMDTKQVVARFEAERQALAMMDHPNIAKVLDAGTTDQGRPFFVMELVRGIRITEYCDQNHLSTETRLELFISVCHAIQHAHQKGIIHRDLKPSNILVTLHDGVPVPKVIDFGIAKAIEQKLTDKTLFTELNQFIGTPAYMSPEQAEMSGLDIDTRSDIYSLGVLLYELLTGQTPFDARELVKDGLDAIRRIIREVEPPRPSTRLSTLAHADLDTVAKARGTGSLELRSRLRGDLDWIVMKALEKDRTRRYETANGFALDLRRHLTDEPVTARAPSAGYKFGKFARRNKVAFAVAAGIAAVLVIATGISTWQAIRAIKAERGQVRLRTEAETARLRAQSEAERAEAGERHAKEAVVALRRRSYAADMKAAQVAIEQNSRGQAARLLANYLPQQGEEDQRGVEWRYLWRQLRGDELATWNLGDGLVGWVRCTPDGRHILSATMGRKFKVHDSETGQVVRELDTTCEDVGVTLPSVSDNGRFLSYLTAGVLSVYEGPDWNLATRVLVPEAKTHFCQTCLSPDGRLLAMHLPATIRILETKTWTPQAADIFVGSAYDNRMQFTRDGTRLLNNDQTGHFRIYDVLTGQDARKDVPYPNVGPLWALDRNDRFLVEAADGSVTLRRFDSLETIWIQTNVHNSTVLSFAFSKDGQTLATASFDQTIALLRVRDGMLIGRLRGHQNELWTVDSSADGNFLFSSSKDGTIKKWRWTPPPDLRRTLGSNEVTIPSFGVANRLLTLDPETKLFSSWVGLERTSWPVPPDLWATLQPTLTNGESLYHDGDARRLVAFGTNDTLTVFGTKDGTVQRQFPLGIKSSRRWAISGNLRWLAVILAINNTAPVQTIQLWDLTTTRMVRELRAVSGFGWTFSRQLAFSPDDRFLAFPNEEHEIVLWNLVERHEERRMKGPVWHLNHLRFSADGKLLAAGGWEGVVYLWDVSGGRLAVPPMIGHGSGVMGVGFARDGRTLHTAGADNTVRFWSTATGLEMLRLNNSFITHALWEQDSLLQLWDSEDGSHRTLEQIPTFAEIEAAEAKAPILTQP